MVSSARRIGKFGRSGILLAIVTAGATVGATPASAFCPEPADLEAGIVFKGPERERDLAFDDVMRRAGPDLTQQVTLAAGDDVRSDTFYRGLVPVGRIHRALIDGEIGILEMRYYWDEDLAGIFPLEPGETVTLRGHILRVTPNSDVYPHPPLFALSGSLEIEVLGPRLIIAGDCRIEGLEVALTWTSDGGRAVPAEHFVWSEELGISALTLEGKDAAIRGEIVRIQDWEPLVPKPLVGTLLD